MYGVSIFTTNSEITLGKILAFTFSEILHMILCERLIFTIQKCNLKQTTEDGNAVVFLLITTDEQLQ